MTSSRTSFREAQIVAKGLANRGTSKRAWHENGGGWHSLNGRSFTISNNGCDALGHLVDKVAMRNLVNSTLNFQFKISESGEQYSGELKSQMKRFISWSRDLEAVPLP